LADKLGIEQKLINGRRITDKDTLDIVTMVQEESIKILLKTSAEKM
jgi:acetylglutamate kinase